MQRVIPCLGLSELVPARPSEQSFGTFLDEMLFCSDLDSCERIYIGSNFCAQLFFAVTTKDVAALIDACKDRDLPLTLTLPIFTERNLDAALSHTDALLEVSEGLIDEITVNDYGMFMHWGSRIEDGTPLKLNLGRLLNKDTRDLRIPEYHESTYQPALLERDQIGSSNLDRLLATWPISGIEFDPTHQLLDLTALPAEIMPALHNPLCYQSTGQVCELASIGLKKEEKFRPNLACKLQCLRNSISYRGSFGVDYLKIGRTLYVEPANASVHGTCRFRSIHTPLKKVLR